MEPEGWWLFGSACVGLVIIVCEAIVTGEPILDEDARPWNLVWLIFAIVALAMVPYIYLFRWGCRRLLRWLTRNEVPTRDLREVEETS